MENKKMSNKIDLSIIIPHYNTPKLLKKLLNSIPIRDNIEVIVIDDKSDKKLNLLKKIISSSKYKQINFLINKTDKKGAGVCRNIGLEKAKGEWLLFADSDDYFVEGFYDIIKPYFDTDNDVVYFKPTSEYIDSGKMADRHKYYAEYVEKYNEDKSMESELNLRYKFLVPWSKMIKRVLVEKNNIKFDEVIAANDVMFSTRVGYFMEKFTIDMHIIYCVTRRKGSLTVNMSDEVFDNRLNVSINYIKFLKDKLTKSELEYFHTAGQGKIFSAIQYGLGFKKAFEVFIKLYKNNIKIFEYKLLNPLYLLKKFKNRYKKSKKINKYITKD